LTDIISYTIYSKNGYLVS